MQVHGYVVEKSGGNTSNQQLRNWEKERKRTIINDDLKKVETTSNSELHSSNQHSRKVVDKLHIVMDKLHIVMISKNYLKDETRWGSTGKRTTQEKRALTKKIELFNSTNDLKMFLHLY